MAWWLTAESMYHRGIELQLRLLVGTQRVEDLSLAVPTVVATINELLGTATWPRPFSWGDPLVTMPTPGHWAVPDTDWHIDFPARSNLQLKWLAYLAPVLPGGGGTVVLAGSHRTVEQFLRDNPTDPGRSATVRETVLAAGPHNVVELTGEPGDMIFLHPVDAWAEAVVEGGDGGLGFGFDDQCWFDGMVFGAGLAEDSAGQLAA